MHFLPFFFVRDFFSVKVQLFLNTTIYNVRIVGIYSITDKIVFITTSECILGKKQINIAQCEWAPQKQLCPEPGGLNI